LKKSHKIGGKLEILMIVKNYTGNRLQFEIALEKAKAMGLCDSDLLIVQDDVSIPKNRILKPTGRRGLAGPILFHKILGTIAESGLTELKSTGERILKNLGTVGVSFSKCSMPGTLQAGKIQDFDGKAQIGLGIHWEEGFATIPFQSTKELAQKVVGIFKNCGYMEKSDSDEPLSGLDKTLEMNCSAMDCLEALGPRMKLLSIYIYLISTIVNNSKSYNSTFARVSLEDMRCPYFFLREAFKAAVSTTISSGSSYGQSSSFGSPPPAIRQIRQAAL
jgi:hypothetical protein